MYERDKSRFYRLLLNRSIIPAIVLILLIIISIRHPEDEPLISILIFVLLLVSIPVFGILKSILFAKIESFVFNAHGIEFETEFEDRYHDPIPREQIRGFEISKRISKKHGYKLIILYGDLKYSADVLQIPLENFIEEIHVQEKFIKILADHFRVHYELREYQIKFPEKVKEIFLK